MRTSTPTITQKIRTQVKIRTFHGKLRLKYFLKHRPSKQGQILQKRTLWQPWL